MSYRLLRLSEGLLGLADRLVDDPIFQSSASLYLIYIQRVMQKLQNMADFFTYSVVIWYNEERVLWNVIKVRLWVTSTN